MTAPLTVQPVILCGGGGTRLWPLSRAHFPKQFLNLFGEQSLFQLAVSRLARMPVAAPLVVGNEEHRFLMRDQLREIGIEPAAILLEPAGRNTAAALSFAAHAAMANGADPVLIISPADQVVMDVPAFTTALTHAVAAATDGAIVLLGIPPDRPETGYGYLRVAPGSDAVAAFVEKPDATTAASYLADGNYFWNSGIFVMRASVWRRELARNRADIAEPIATAWQGREADGPFIRPAHAAFLATPSESIDYAVMEHCPGIADIRMVKLDAGWSDLGSWESTWTSAPKDARGNAAVGDALIRDSSNTYIHASSRLVCAVGLTDVIIVETPDAVLVTDRARSQEVKHLVATLDATARDEHTHHRKVHRPWGWYDSVDEGPRFKVKRIMVNPGASLSLQKHAKRSEHWVVVSGTAEVTCGEKMLQLHENQSTYIPLGETHRLRNPGTTPLEIIEVQSGDYLGEDDIVRLEDDYGLASSKAA